MPENVQYSGSAAYGRSFVVFGGHQGLNTPQWNTIYWFDPDNYEWVLLGTRLLEERFNVHGVTVSDDLVSC